MTDIAASKRFFQPEVSKYYWLPAIAATTMIPTRPEITAGSVAANSDSAVTA